MSFQADATSTTPLDCQPQHHPHAIATTTQEKRGADALAAGRSGGGDGRKCEKHKIEVQDTEAYRRDRSAKMETEDNRETRRGAMADADQRRTGRRQ